MTDATILEARSLALLDQPRNASSKCWHLPDEHFCDAVKAELAGVPFRAIVQELEANGLPAGKLPGRSQWSEFWQAFKPWLRLARRKAAATGANETAAEAAKSPAEFDTATLDLIRQMAFELADSDAPDPKGVKSLVSVLLKHDEQKLKERQVAVSERRISLLEDNAKQAKAKLESAVKAGGITPETLKLIEEAAKIL